MRPRPGIPDRKDHRRRVLPMPRLASPTVPGTTPDLKISVEEEETQDAPDQLVEDPAEEAEARASRGVSPPPARAEGGLARPGPDGEGRGLNRTAAGGRARRLA